MPKQSANWTCVKRTDMNLSQYKYFKMVQKRANKRPQCSNTRAYPPIPGEPI
ncbi:unnamed protein product [Penicillium nalgiovense]|nr:unnamed protein product [Penicillium nalgiovense]